MKRILARTAKVIREYRVTYKGYNLVVPVGATVTNQTACGPDNSYRFWQDWQAAAEQATGFKNSTLAHDLTHYGLNVPADHCEPYERNLGEASVPDVTEPFTDSRGNQFLRRNGFWVGLDLLPTTSAKTTLITDPKWQHRLDCEYAAAQRARSTEVGA